MKYLRYGVLFLVLTNSYAEDEIALGRLFFDENERLDLYARYKQALLSSDQATLEEEKPTIPARIRLNGLIIRSGGENTVWIDDIQNPQKQGLYGLKLEVEGLSIKQTEVPILIHSGDIQVYLKPGQIMDTTNGWITETYVDSAAPANDS